MSLTLLPTARTEWFVNVISSGWAFVWDSITTDSTTWILSVLGVFATTGIIYKNARDTQRLSPEKNLEVSRNFVKKYYEREQSYIKGLLTQDKLVFVIAPRGIGRSSLASSVLLEESQSRPNPTQDSGIGYCRRLEHYDVFAPNKPCQVLRVDLRVAAFADFYGYMAELSRYVYDGPIDQFISAIRRVRSVLLGSDDVLKTSGEIEYESNSLELSRGDSADLNRWSKVLSTLLRLYPQNFVMFIDSLESLHPLARSIVGLRGLSMYLNMLISFTKSGKNQRVITTCSGWFYLEHGMSTSFRNNVRAVLMADKTKDEVYDYVTKEVSELPPYYSSTLLEKEYFNSCFDILGGRLADWEDYINELKLIAIHNTVAVNKIKKEKRCAFIRQLAFPGIKNFPLFGASRTILSRALHPGNYTARDLADKGPVRWTHRQCLTAFKLIVDAKFQEENQDNDQPNQGFVSYAEMSKALHMCEDHHSCDDDEAKVDSEEDIPFTDTALRSLLKHEILIFRPQNPCSFDSPKNLLEDVVGPIRPFDIFIMKELLDNQTH